MVSVFNSLMLTLGRLGEHSISWKPRRETILHFFYKITNKRGTKTVFTYAHVKWFYGQSERVYYLNYFIIISVIFLSLYQRCIDCLLLTVISKREETVQESRKII